MATTYRRRHNLIVTTLGATLATGATSITLTAALQEGGSNIATLGTDEYLALTISPAAAPNEVVYLTAYTAGATTGTIVRAREGTVDPGTTYASGTPVEHAPTKGEWPTAKGGMVVGAGTNKTTEKAVGADGQAWTADSASDVGAKWAWSTLTIEAQTGTTYTVDASDPDRLVTLNNAGAVTVTLPQDSDVTFAVGSQVTFMQLGAGQPSFVAGTGATVEPSGTIKTRAAGSMVTAIKRAANTWLLIGDVELAAWTSYTPGFSGGTLGNGTVSGRYQILGNRTMLLHLQLTSGSTTSIAANTKMSFDLPSGTAVNAAPDQAGSAVLDGNVFLGTALYVVGCAIQRNTTTVKAQSNQAISGAGWGLYLSIAIELA